MRLPPGFRGVDGRLAIGGVPVDRLAVVAGQTPLFAYDRDMITDRVAALRTTLPTDVALSYAVKANPMPALLHHLSGLVDGFDVASATELRHTLDTTMDAAHISFAGPGKTRDELSRAVAAGVLIEAESPRELQRLEQIGTELGVQPRVALRVNPDFAVRGAGVRLGGGPQQFGIDSEQIPATLEALADADLAFEGFHVFAGSQNLRADSICEAQQRTVELVLGFADLVPAPIRYLNLGGGFGIPYSDRDQPLDVVPIAENLDKLLETLVRPQLPDAQVVIELGRYLVGEAGVYLTRVVERKISRGRTFLVVDGGMHHQLAASGNLGQTIRRNYPVAVATRWGADPVEPVDVVGCLCTSLDLLANNVSLPRADEGDIVAVFQAGAYGLTASPTAFLSHPAPVELLV